MPGSLLMEGAAYRKFVLLSVWLSSNAFFVHISSSYLYSYQVDYNCILPILFLLVLSISLRCLSLLSKSCLHWQVLPCARLFFSLFRFLFLFFFNFFITVFDL